MGSAEWSDRVDTGQPASMGNVHSAGEEGTGRMNMFDLANLLDQDGNLQNEMMVMAFAATLLATIPVLLGNEFDVNVGLKRRKRRAADALDEKWRQVKFYLRTLPKIIKKVQSRDPAFLNSLEEQQ